MKRADIERIVFTAVGELNATLPDSKHVPTEGGTRLLGEGGRGRALPHRRHSP